jgi:phenylacetate-coenzyme A ligase PaaK-like adenylate-forming protein
MSFKTQLKREVLQMQIADFEHLSFELFRYQAENNPIYSNYLRYLGINPSQIKELHKIPFLPIEFFKYHKVFTGEEFIVTVFESSGTTSTQNSKHYVSDLSFYEQNCLTIFEKQFGDIQEWTILALLPSYLERNNASLVAMTDFLIRKSKPESGFFLHDTGQINLIAKNALQKQQKVMIIGVTFALLDWAEQNPDNLSGAILIETGGMKGRRKEIVREELHEVLCRAFSLQKIGGEYGMTELFSQAYSKGDGWFEPPTQMRIFLRDMYDPFDVSKRKHGAVNVIDLANIDSCAFIETKDIGMFHPTIPEQFAILGRLDNTDIRGCNLMVSA